MSAQILYLRQAVQAGTMFSSGPPVRSFVRSSVTSLVKTIFYKQIN